jgi:hypothetical protein
MSSQNTKRQSINPPSTQAMYDALHFSQATRISTHNSGRANCVTPTAEEEDS